MSFSEVCSTILKVRRVIVIISLLAGTGYKVAPMVYHKSAAKAETKTAAAKAPANPAREIGTTTNSAGEKLSSRDLGAVALTNHYETCVSLGKGTDCLLTPKAIDSGSVELTVAVESKTTAGKIHDLSITQVIAKLGKPVDVAVGNFSFSFTPNLTESE
jgi:hypothetical protein